MRRKGVDLRIGFQAVEHRHQDRIHHGKDHYGNNEHHKAVDGFVACLFQIMFGQNSSLCALHPNCPPY
ncbi:hypothetical protein D3C81_2226960 [compost metagenome]